MTYLVRLPRWIGRLLRLEHVASLLEAHADVDEQRARAEAALALANEELRACQLKSIWRPLERNAKAGEIESRMQSLRAERLEVLESERTSRATNSRTRQRVRLLEKIIDRVPVSFLFKDRDGKILYMNEATRSLSPMPNPTVESIEGSSSLETWDRAEAERFIEDDRRIIDSGKPEMYPETVTTSVGVRLLVTAACPVEDENSILKACMDVTGIWRDIARMAEGAGL